MLHPIRRLLSVAISDYPKTKYDLNGCRYDQLLMYKICKEKYGFTEFKVLTDEEATKVNIRRALDWLVTDIPRGSTIVFQFSGHGTSLPVTTKTATSEIDNLDECIVTYDFDPRNPLRDNELGEQFKHIDPSIHIFVLLDACTSGTGLRGCMPQGSKNRYIQPPPSVMLETGELNIDDDLGYLSLDISKNRKIEREPFLIRTIDQGNAILLSGCAEGEYAADARFGNRWHGACTFFMAQTLKENEWKINYKSLATEVNRKLDEAGFTSQTPQLECENCFDATFLGGPK